MKGSPADVRFCGQVTELWLMYIGERKATANQLEVADILAGFDTPKMRNAYLRTTDKPTIKGYIRFVQGRAK